MNLPASHLYIAAMRFLAIGILALLPFSNLAQYGCRLLEAVRTNKISEIQEVIGRDNGQSVNCFKSDEWLSPLMLAAKNNNLDAVKLLLSYGADINQSLGNKKVIDHAGSGVKSFIKEYKHSSHMLVKAAGKGDMKQLKSFEGSQFVDFNVYNDDNHNALTLATENQQLEVIEYLLSKGVSPDHPQRIYLGEKRALQIAADKNYLDCAKLLLKKGADPNAKMNHGWTPLLYAIQNNHTTMAKLLIDNGARIQQPLHNGVEPLSLAAYRGNLEILKYMVEKGAALTADASIADAIFKGAYYSGNKELVDYIMESPLKSYAKNKSPKTLINACQSGNLELVKQLVDIYGYDVNAQDEYKFTPLTSAAGVEGGAKIMAYLLAKGANIEGPGHAGYTAITRALGNLENLEFLLEAGANPNPPGVIQSPIVSAAAFNEPEAIEMLIKYGADVNDHKLIGQIHNPKLKAMINAKKELLDSVRVSIDKNEHGKVIDYCKEYGSFNMIVDEQGQTPLIRSIKVRNIALAIQLLKAGASPNLCDKHGRYPLTLSAESDDNLELTKLLCQYGANVNKLPANSYFILPLVAARGGAIKSLKFLETKGLNLSAQGDDQKTILHHACQSMDEGLIRYLLSKGLDINAKDKYGTTPFITACQKGSLDFIRFLVEEHNADIKAISNNGGMTALINATYHQKTDVVNYLLSKGADIYANLNNLRSALQVSAFLRDSVHIFEDFLARADSFPEFYGYHNIIHDLYKQGYIDRIGMIAKKFPQVVDSPQARHGGLPILYEALIKRDTTSASKLLAWGADINYRLSDSATILHYLIQQNIDSYIIKYILENGADPNLKGMQQMHTPLMMAISKGSYYMLKHLVDFGANVNARNKDGAHAVHYLYPVHKQFLVDGESINTKNIKFLKQYGLDLKAKDNIGTTGLIAAAQAGDYAAVKYFHENGLSIDDTTQYGGRAVWHASLLHFPPTRHDGFGELGPQKVYQVQSIGSEPYYSEEILKYLIDNDVNLDFYCHNSQFSYYPHPSGRIKQRIHFVYMVIRDNPEAAKIILPYLPDDFSAHGLSLKEYCESVGRGDLVQ